MMRKILSTLLAVMMLTASPSVMQCYVTALKALTANGGISPFPTNPIRTPISTSR